MFVQRLSAAGVPEWVLVGDGDGDGDDGRRRSGSRGTDGGGEDGHPGAAAAATSALLGRSLYADMLHDRRRADAYAAALTAVLGVTRPNPLILDVGTGSGLLAVLAARAAPGPGAATVVAVDQFPPMVAVARETADRAGCGPVITVHACRSDELVVRSDGGGGQSTAPSLPRRADVVVAEILDSVLVGEGALPTAADVGARLLAPDGVAIPARGRILAQPVVCPALRAHWDAAAWCGTPAGLGDDATPRPWHLDALVEKGGLVPVGEPVTVLELDLTRPPRVSGRARTEIEQGATPSRVDALAVWWEVDLTPDGAVVLDTAPAWAAAAAAAARRRASNHAWTDHWRPCWVPVSGGGPGARVTVEAEYGPADLSVRAAAVDGAGGAARPAVSLAAAYAPSGAGLAATAGRAAALAAAVGGAAAATTTTAHALTLGDGPLPALVVSKEGCASVTAVVTSTPAAAAGVRAVVPPAVEVVASLPPRPPATLLVSEPHYRATDGRPPWEATVRFLRDRAALVAAGALAADATLCPAGARVVCVGAATPDLARTAGPLGAVAGVDMAPFDAAAGPRTGRWLQPCRPVATQVGECREVTGRAVVGGGGGMAGLAGFTAVGPVPPRLGGQAVLHATEGGATVDALAFWVEYTATPTSTVPAWTSGDAPALFLLPAAVAVPSPGGLVVALDLKITAEAELGGRLDVRAGVEVGT